MEFTKLEAAALSMFVDEYEQEFPGLAAQLRAARPKSRENTGGGFFTHLQIDETSAVLPLNLGSGPLDSVGVRPEGMQSKLELLLFFKDGLVYLIEGYSMEGEDTSAVDFDAGEFSDLALVWPRKSS